MKKKREEHENPLSKNLISPSARRSHMRDTVLWRSHMRDPTIRLDLRE